VAKRESSVAAHFAMDAKNRLTMRLFGVRRPAAALPGAQIRFSAQSLRLCGELIGKNNQTAEAQRTQRLRRD
jgi:hypothetical protein